MSRLLAGPDDAELETGTTLDPRYFVPPGLIFCVALIGRVVFGTLEPKLR